ncbi:GGDEF domain-containing protein [Mangrovihabitans endophyticus]|nr:GGDEF domain-containing protein [Mangrovihabitans endophyticus]
MAAAPYVFVTGVFLTPAIGPAGIVAVIVTSVTVAVVGALCWFRPEALPGWFWLSAPHIATVFITGINLATADASTGAQLFYMWPVLYAANFLRRRQVAGSVALAVAGDAACTFGLLDPGRAMADWTAMTLAMVMLSVVVVPLRERAEQLMRRLESQALADPLTALANRRSFDDALAAAGAWAQRTGRPLALLTVDLDHFKTINDTYGHAVGDDALRAVADAMRAVAEEDDVVARLGGDEFALLIRTDRRGALHTGEGLRARVAAIDTLPGGAPGISIGLAVLPDDADSTAGLQAASDAALYVAKTHGRGRVAAAGGHPAPGPQPVLSPQPAR